MANKYQYLYLTVHNVFSGAKYEQAKEIRRLKDPDKEMYTDNKDI